MTLEQYNRQESFIIPGNYSWLLTHQFIPGIFKTILICIMVYSENG